MSLQARLKLAEQFWQTAWSSLVLLMSIRSASTRPPLRLVASDRIGGDAISLTYVGACLDSGVVGFHAGIIAARDFDEHPPLAAITSGSPSARFNADRARPAERSASSDVTGGQP
jgi:hypothetical protein